MTNPPKTETTQVYRIYIRAEAQAIWDALTQPEWTARYGYTGYAAYDLRPGGAYTVRATEAFKAAGEANGRPVPDVVIAGEVIEADPPHRLVQTWRMAMDPQAAAEGFTRLTYEITEGGGPGVCRLTVIHEVGSAPSVAAMIEGAPGAEQELGGGGWPWILSDLKTLLETGSSFTAASPA